MTRKAARGRKTAAGTRTSTKARTTTRTGRKTASARATKIAPPVRSKRGGATATARPVQAAQTETLREPLPVAQREDDEEMDWLGEDEDPRSQIVEDDDEWEPGGDDEW